MPGPNPGGIYDALLDAIIRAAGGADNIGRAASCATRLRLSLADPALADDAALGGIPGCAGVIKRGRERHLVFGVSAARIRGALDARLLARAPVDKLP